MLVVVGVGGIGEAVVHRMGGGRHVLLADLSETAMAGAAHRLADGGHRITTRGVDVSSPESVAELAAAARSLGAVGHVVHTAGLSPAQAGAEAILRVDLLGVALVLDAFAGAIAPGGAGVVIASMAGHLGASLLTPEQEAQLAGVPTAELLHLPFADPAAVSDPGLAYVIAKRGSILRVQAAAGPWGVHGARINSISPGIIATAMGRQELASESGGGMRAMVDASATGRLGTPEEIAAAAAFLLGPEASFVTGTDLLVDGGVVAAFRSGGVTSPG